MLKILGGGSSMASDALLLGVYFLKESFHKGQRRYIRCNARNELIVNCPEGRLHIDGKTYYAVH